MKTELDLYRSLRKADWKSTPSTPEAAEKSGALHPSFVETTYRKGPDTFIRPADVRVEAEDGVNYAYRKHRDGKYGGTSLFDRRNVMGAACRDFALPKGTEIPEGLQIRFTHRNTRYDADHYQIECLAGRMELTAFRGALDNLARNAVVRQIELVKG